MPVFYALVARRSTVLAEQTVRSGNFPTITRALLGKITDVDQKLSYGYDNFMFHIVVDRGITYLCLADEKQKRRIPFLFLDDVRAKFQAAYGERATTAIAFAMNTEFSRVLQDRMDYFNDNPEADSLAKVKGQIEDVKGVMVDNIEKVLARGEKIELLVDKTEQLNQSAKKFQRASKSLKSAMWWKNVKMWGLIVSYTAAAQRRRGRECAAEQWLQSTALLLAACARTLAHARLAHALARRAHAYQRVLRSSSSRSSSSG
jgi:vesicle-associated membrane protein 7